MSVYYPQAVMLLRVLWEDFKLKSDPSLQSVYLLPVMARRLSVHLNDYTTADTFEAEIDYKTFPFDPRCIRSCGVSIHLGDMGHLYRNGILEQIPIEAKNKADEKRVERELRRRAIFMGSVDEESIEFDEESRTVKIEGRDFTSHLIDQKYLENTKLPVHLTSPLDKVIQNLISQVKGAEKIELENRTGKELPTLAQFAPDFGALGASKNVEKNDTYWEIIQDLAARAGLICFIELDKLVLTTPRVLYNKENAKQFIYGKNVKSLRMVRKLGRHKGFNVLVRWMDLANKRVETVEIPREATEAWSKETGIERKRVQIPVVNPDGSLGTPKDAPMRAFRVTNVKNRDHLIQIGQQIFEEMSRQELSGELTTREMETMDGQNASFDLLKLRVGTPISIEISQDDLNGISRISDEARRVQFLMARGYEKDVASAFAKSMGKFSPIFYTKAASFSMDADEAFELKVDFLNFVDLDNRGINFG